MAWSGGARTVSGDEGTASARTAAAVAAAAAAVASGDGGC
jgi:hypothetical protein